MKAGNDQRRTKEGKVEKTTKNLAEELNRFLAERREAIKQTIRKADILPKAGYRFVDPRSRRIVEVEVKR